MLRAEYPMLLTNFATYEKEGKKMNVLTVVSLDDGNSMKLYSDKTYTTLTRWEKYNFDISVNNNNGKTYYNLNGVRPITK